MLSMITSLSIPIRTGTVGVTGNISCPSTGVKASIGVWVVAAVLGLAGAGFACASIHLRVVIPRTPWPDSWVQSSDMEKRQVTSQGQQT